MRLPGFERWIRFVISELSLSPPRHGGMWESFYCNPPTLHPETIRVSILIPFCCYLLDLIITTISFTHSKSSLVVQERVQSILLKSSLVIYSINTKGLVQGCVSSSNMITTRMQIAAGWRYLVTWRSHFRSQQLPPSVPPYLTQILLIQHHCLLMLLCSTWRVSQLFFLTVEKILKPNFSS